MLSCEAIVVVKKKQKKKRERERENIIGARNMCKKKQDEKTEKAYSGKRVHAKKGTNQVLLTT